LRQRLLPNAAADLREADLQAARVVLKEAEVVAPAAVAVVPEEAVRHA
jgi:hypothetical protein